MPHECIKERPSTDEIWRSKGCPCWGALFWLLTTDIAPWASFYGHLYSRCDARNTRMCCPRKHQCFHNHSLNGHEAAIYRCNVSRDSIGNLNESVAVSAMNRHFDWCSSIKKWETHGRAWEMGIKTKVLDFVFNQVMCSHCSMNNFPPIDWSINLSWTPRQRLYIDRPEHE